MTTTETGTTTPDLTAEIASALLSVARTMNQVRVHEALCRRAGVDLDRSGAAVLYKLVTEGEHVRLTDLAERLGVDSPAVTRKVQQLERRRLVSRAADPQDARASRLALTAAGRRAIERLLAARQAWLGELLQDWSEGDRGELARLLGLLAATVGRHTEVRHGR